MAKNLGTVVENQFTQGLVTEATGLNFPEHAAIESWNTRYHRKGNVTRRLGYNLERGTLGTVATAALGACRSYIWKGVGNSGAKSFLVVQNGKFVSFYEPDESGNFSDNVKDFYIDLETYKTEVTEDVSLREAGFASGTGKLFIVHPYIEPVYVTYNEDTDDIEVTQYEILVRDFEGVDDGYLVDERRATLDNLHKYNLFNQGWYKTKVGENRVDPLYHMRFTSGLGIYPSNADIWWSLVNANGNFAPGDMEGRVSFGNTPAPKGHFIYNSFDINREEVSGISGPEGKSSNGFRPSCVAFYAGRIWYGGVEFPEYSGNIYYTQIILRDEQIGKCYQLNDPTNETLSDLLDTDGGVVRVQGMGKNTGLFSAGNKLIIFANNGVWAIGGSGQDGVGFVATDFTVSRVTNIGLESPSSIVDVEGTPVWWNNDGIWTITADKGVISLTNETIKEFYEETIPVISRQYAQGAFNPLEKTIQWLWKSETGVDVADEYNYDRILEYNTSTNAFYPFRWSVSDVAFNSIFCTAGVFTIDRNLETVVDSGDVVVTDSTPEDVEVYRLGNRNYTTSKFKYIRVTF